MGIQNFFVNEKAILEILDLREIEDVKKKPSPHADGSSGTTLSQADLSKMVDLADAVGDFSASSDYLQQTIMGSGVKNLTGVTLRGSKKQFQVQFNPGDLQIEGHGGGRMATTAFNNVDEEGRSTAGAIDFKPVPVHINLSVKLLFDRMNPNECFLSAKTNIAPSEIAKSVVKTGLTAAGVNKKMTVQQEVEGLIAALRSPYTRCITFNWGDMSYTGVLNRVSAQYTMFNSSGIPVRAVVQLSLVCADQTVSPNSLGEWQDDYEAAFGAGSKSLGSWTQKAGSLVNFGK
ncbi:MAG: hypothetical protein ACI4EC_02355 [Lachnospiraceae bacterium]